MQNTFRRNRWALFEFCLVTAFTFLLFQFLFSFTNFYVYQVRDLFRAENLAAGHWIFFGPEASGGGNLPGPFLYFLLSLPLKLGLEWQGAWQWMILLHALTAASFWSFSQHRWGTQIALWNLAGFLASTPFVISILFFWSASYVTLFLFLTVVALLVAYSPGKHRERAWFATCALIGLTMQIHMIVSFLLLAALILQVAGPRWQVPRLGWRCWLQGFLILFIPLAPFFAWKAATGAGLVWGQDSFAAAGPFANAPLFLVRDTWLSFFAAHNPDRIRDWTSFQREVVTFLSPPTLAILVFSLLRRKDLFHQPSPIPAKARLLHDLRILTILGLVGLIPAMKFLLLNRGERYLVLVTLVLPMILSLWAFTKLPPQDDLKKNIFWGTLAALVTSSVLCLDLGPQFLRVWQQLDRVSVFGFLGLFVFALVVSFRNPALPRLQTCAFTLSISGLILASISMANYRYGSERLPTVLDLQEMSKTIYAQTGWSYDELRRRIVFVVMHRDMNIQSIYEQVIHQTMPPSKPNAGIDGYLVVGSVTDVWRDELDPEIAEAIRSGALKLGTPEIFGRLTLISYRSTGTDGQRRTFQNVGRSYEKNIEFEKLFPPGQPRKKRQVRQDQITFYWNFCPLNSQPCEVGALVQLSAGTHPILSLDLVGSVVSYTSAWIAPELNGGLERPYLAYFCGADRHQVELADCIGICLPKERRHILAPYHREVQTLCAPEKIEVGWKTSHLNSSFQRIWLQGQFSTARFKGK